MKKTEAESAFPHLFDMWAETLTPEERARSKSYSKFESWAHANGYSLYWDFHSLAGPRFDVEMWFDVHFKQAGLR